MKPGFIIQEEPRADQVSRQAKNFITREQAILILHKLFSWSMSKSELNVDSNVTVESGLVDLIELLEFVKFASEEHYLGDDGH